MSNLEKLKERREEILRRIEITKEDKRNLLRLVHDLLKQYNSGRISKREYDGKLKKALKNRTAEEWLIYYDEYIDIYDRYLKECEGEIKKEQARSLEDKIEPVLKTSVIIALIVVMISVSIILRPVLINNLKNIQEKITSIDLGKIGEKEKIEVREGVEREIVEREVEEYEEPKIEVSLEDKEIKIIEEELIQYQAVLGQPVKWKKKFSIDSITGFTVELPKDASNIKVKRVEDGKEEDITDIIDISKKRTFFIFGERAVEVSIRTKKITGMVVGDNGNNQEQEFEIEYETPAPEIFELEKKGAEKRVLVKGPDDVHYKDIISFTELPREFSREEAEKLKLYKIENNRRTAVDFNVYDTNENSLIDKIGWITDYLSEAEFIIIIEISKAEHLDEERNFISDIYNETYQLDGIWSETINDNEYVRVTFSKMLDRGRDITIYPRVISRNPKIEVYEVGGSEKIAVFENLMDNEYNTILLTNLQREQDVFDLKIVGGSVEIEHIVDPTAVHFEGFEVDTDGWPISDDAFRSNWGGSMCDDSGDCSGMGNYGMAIQDATSVSYTEQNFDFFGYSSVEINFWSQEDSGLSWESGEYVLLECDDNEVWRQDDNDCTVGTWCFYSVVITNSDCPNGGLDNSVKIEFTGYPGLAGKFDDNWFIDGINITGYVGPTETVENTNDVGLYSSIAIDSNNIVHISHFDDANSDLRYCNNTGGEWSCVAVETANEVGWFSSIAIDSNNIVHISYFDNTNGDLRYCNNTGETWSCVAVETANIVGLYSSIAIDSNNIIHISHYDDTNSDLRYCNNIGGEWSCKKITDVSSNYLGYPNGRALAIKKGRLTDSTDFSNYAHASYYSDTDLKYAKILIYELDLIAPDINFTDPTPSDGEIIGDDNFTINVTADDIGKGDNNISVFIDFNNSLVGWWRMDDVGNWCYQESANKSTACGGLGTGSYSGLYSSVEWVDGDWDSYVSSLEAYINYTRPSNALSSSLWKIKFDDVTSTVTMNVSIPSTCWAQTPLQFYLYSGGAGYGTSKFKCYNGTDFEEITKGTKNIYEEAMWWFIEDFDGDVVADYLSYSNDGTHYGDAKQGEGFLGKGFEFDGDGDYINIPTSPSLTIDGALTVSAWVNVTNSDNWDRIIQRANESGNGFSLRIDQSSNFIFQAKNYSDSYNARSDGQFNFNKWYHLVGVYDGVNAPVLYVNGVLAENSILDSAEDNGGTNINIGKKTNAAEAPYYYFNGIIDDVMIFNRALTEEEILALYANSPEKFLNVSFDNLENGNYAFKAYAQDTAGNVNSTEEREVEILKDLTKITGCMVLGQANEVYVMENDIENNGLTSACINITVDNVTLDCKGHYIKSDNNYAGVYSNSNYTIIKNCNVSMGTGLGGYGIYLYEANNSYVLDNSLNGQDAGLYLWSVYNSIIEGNTVNSNNIGIELLMSSNNNVTDSNFSGNTDKDVWLAGYSINNIFLNVSYNTSSENVPSSSQLIRKWYYQANISYDGAPINNANLSAYNRTGIPNGWQFNLTSKEDGLTNITTIIDYINTGTRNYYSNYTISTTNGTLSESHKLNVTWETEQEGFGGLIFENIVLKEIDTTPPDINFTWPTPSDGEIIEENNFMINVTADDIDKGDNNISLFIDFNNSLVGWWRMDDVGGTTVYDNSTYNNDGIFNGNEELGETVFNPASTYDFTSITSVDSDSVAIAYKDSDYYGKFVVYNIDGTKELDEIVFNPAFTTDTSIISVDSDSVAIAYEDWGNDRNGTFVVYNIDGTNELGETVFNPAITIDTSITSVDSDSVAIAYRDSDDSGTFVVYNIDGTKELGETVFNPASTYYTSITSVDSDSVAIAYKDSDDSGTFVVYNVVSKIVEGKMGKGLSFDGEDDYIEVYHDPSLNNTKGTVSMWLKPAFETADISIISSFLGLGNSPDNYKMFTVRFEGRAGQGVPEDSFSVWIDGGYRLNTTTLTQIKDKWFYLVFTYDFDNDVYELYKDGLFIMNSTASLNPTYDGFLQIANFPQNPNYPFNGTIDDVMIFNRALSEEEIYALYANTSSKYLFNNFTDLLDGDYSFRAYAQDLWGNVNSTEERSVVVSLPNVAPEIIYVEYSSNIIPNEDGYVNVSINFTAYDINGFADLSAETARANFTKKDYTDENNLRENLTCSFEVGWDNYANYSCNIEMWYFDKPGDWNITVAIADSATLWSLNDTEIFQYDPLTGMIIAPDVLDWGIISSGGKDQKLPYSMIVNNTGNMDIGELEINATALVGQLDSSFFINSSNFSVNVVDACGGNELNDSEIVNITGSVLIAGNHSVNNRVTAQEELFFCLEEVPFGLKAQTYSTPGTRAWIIYSGTALLLVAVVIKRKRKAKKKDSLEVFDENLRDKYIDFDSLLGLDEKLREKYGLGAEELLNIAKRKEKRIVNITNENILEFLDDKLKERYKIGVEDLLELVKKEEAREEIKIPIIVFRQEIGALEVLCKYLKENLGLRFSEIAELINRDERSIWISYRNAIKKKKEKIEAEEKMLIPISVFSDRRLSILESLVAYLKQRGFRNSEIARILNKDQRNIYTLYARAKKKMKK